MRDHLADYLLPGHERQPHITVHLSGFSGTGNGLADDYIPDAFSAELEALKTALIEPFSIDIGAPATFTSAAYFSIRDSTGSIARVRHTLGDHEPADGEPPFTPHLTFGLYCGQFPLAQVMERMLNCPEQKEVRLKISKLTLMTYEAAVITGPLTPVCEFDLARQSLQVLDQEELQALRE
jgi:2'-5' RNA ligase